MKYFYIIITGIAIYCGIGGYGEIVKLTAVNRVSTDGNIVYFTTN
jgi:hypothetical protein